MSGFIIKKTSEGDHKKTLGGFLKEKYLPISLLSLFLLFVYGPLQAQDTLMHEQDIMHEEDTLIHGQEERVIILQAGELEWQDGPPSFEEGAQFALLEGDLGEEEFFNLRLKLPDGFVISPHWHPNIERVTVISGTFRLGHGEVMDPENTEALGAGSYFSLPPEMGHFAITEGETIVQLTTLGPWEIHYFNPDDDPRNR